eukprot:scaffold35758_cov54-Attheya_sp.AAC.1
MANRLMSWFHWGHRLLWLVLLWSELCLQIIEASSSLIPQDGAIMQSGEQTTARQLVSDPSLPAPKRRRRRSRRGRSRGRRGRNRSVDKQEEAPATSTNNTASVVIQNPSVGPIAQEEAEPIEEIEIAEELIETFEYILEMNGAERAFNDVEQLFLTNAFNESYSVIRSNPTVTDIEVYSQEIREIDEEQQDSDSTRLRGIRQLGRRRSLIARFRGLSLCRRCPRKRIRDPLFESRTKRRFLQDEDEIIGIAGFDSARFLETFKAMVLSGPESLVEKGLIQEIETISTTVEFVDLTTDSPTETPTTNEPTSPAPTTDSPFTQAPTEAPTNLPTAGPTITPTAGPTDLPISSLTLSPDLAMSVQLSSSNSIIDGSKSSSSSSSSGSSSESNKSAKSSSSSSSSSGSSSESNKSAKAPKAA